MIHLQKLLRHYQMHLYLTSKYLYVPPHGSPNNLWSAFTKHLIWLLHIPLTILSDTEDLQCVVRIAGCGHVCPSCVLPYIALDTWILELPGQVIYADASSQTITSDMTKKIRFFTFFKILNDWNYFTYKES